MKKIFYLLLFVLTCISCKKQNTNLKEAQTFTGDFLYLEDIAVLKGTDFIYKLVIDSTVIDLEERVKQIKKEPYDMVEVKLIGILSDNQTSEVGWEKSLQIKEILSIAEQTSKTDILIQH